MLELQTSNPAHDKPTISQNFERAYMGLRYKRNAIMINK